MDVESLVQLNSFGKTSQIRIQLAFVFEDIEQKQCRCCRQNKNPKTDFARSTLCKKCHSQKIMEAQRRRRGYGKIRDKIIWKNCNLCNQSVKTTQWNARRQCCLSCGKKIRATETARPKCLQCGKGCSEKKNKFCSYDCHNKHRGFGFVEIACGNCGKQLKRKKWLADKHKAYACSLECGKIVAARRSKEEWKKRRPQLKSSDEARRIYKEKLRQARIKANDKFKSLWFKKCCIRFAVEIDCTCRWMKKSRTAVGTLKSRSRKGIEPHKKQETDWNDRVKSERKRIKIVSKRRIRNGWSVKVATASRALKRR
jgi:hypothetical protein